MSVGAGANPGL